MQGQPKPWEIQEDRDEMGSSECCSLDGLVDMNDTRPSSDAPGEVEGIGHMAHGLKAEVGRAFGLMQDQMVEAR